VTSAANLVTTIFEDGVAVLEPNDPGRRNVLSVELSRALADAVAGVVSGGAGAIVLTAAPPVFSSGGDIDVLTRTPVPFDALYEGFLALAETPVPTAWQCLPPEDVHETAIELAIRAATRDRPLVRRTKQTLRGGTSITSAAEAVAAERDAQEWAVSRPEFRQHMESIRRRLAHRSAR
jgi:enoyl-CoA hydratase/carnithine racemase